MNTESTHITTLIEQCKKQEKAAQFKLYQLYYKAIYNTTFRILKNEVEAEDIMQETLITAFQKLNSFKGSSTFGSWLKRIAINKSLTKLKNNNRFDETSLDVVRGIEIPNEEEISLNSVNVKYILQCINELKDKNRIVLTLNLIEGFDYEEIANVLGYTNQNVRKIISRAKQQLKQHINIQKIYEK